MECNVKDLTEWKVCTCGREIPADWFQCPSYARKRSFSNYYRIEEEIA